MDKKKGNEVCNHHICNHRFAFMLDNGLRKLFQHPKRIMDGYIRAGDRVMDLGCGPGYFTVEIAEMVGSEGQVIAADLQPEMLEKVKKKAEKRGVADRIRLHQCDADGIAFDEAKTIDFVLAYYMIHETPNPKNILKEIYKLLSPGGQLLLVEPKMHVGQEKFEEMVADAWDVGFEIVDYPKKKGGRALLLKTGSAS